MSLGPFDLTGGPFLILYACLFLLVLVAGLIIPRRLRPAGRRQGVTDIGQLAILTGGGRRFCEAIVAGLLARRVLSLSGGRNRLVFAVAGRDPAAPPAERSILALHPPVRWHDISEALATHVAQLRQKMTASGLLATDAERASLRFWALLPWLMLLVFGAVTWFGGEAPGRAGAMLIALLVVTAILALVRAFTIDERTRAGIEALDHARTGRDRLRRAPTREETGLAVALFGTVALAGTAWADFHKHRSGDSGGCGSAGGSCGSGCGNSSGCGGGGGCGGD
jgi:uncharacterized protein (TIGR04222 family)